MKHFIQCAIFILSLWTLYGQEHNSYIPYVPPPVQMVPPMNYASLVQLIQEVIRNQNPYMNVNPFPVYQYPSFPQTNNVNYNLRKEKEDKEEKKEEVKVKFKEKEEESKAEKISKDLLGQINEFKKIVADLNRTRTLNENSKVNIPIQEKKMLDKEHNTKEEESNARELMISQEEKEQFDKFIKEILIHLNQIG